MKEEEGEEEEERNNGTEGTVGKIVPKNLDIIRLEVTENLSNQKFAGNYANWYK